MIRQNVNIWLARLFIGSVFFFNVQCAIAFLAAPQVYAPGFELAGPAGEGIVRGLGLLFLMWNVPYAVALWQPVNHRLSLIEAILMQAIGAIGETLILISFPAGHETIYASVIRFILFDATGLVLLLLAAFLSARLLANPGINKA